RLPPPPSSTLFPYTTLFRSPRGGQRAAADDPPRPPAAAGGTGTGGHAPREAPGGPRGPARADLPYRGGRVSAPLRLGIDGRELRDRKSTRLNSSHVAISYAV